MGQSAWKKTATYLGLIDSRGPRSQYQRVFYPRADSSRRQAMLGLGLGIFIALMFIGNAAITASWWAVAEALIGVVVAVPIIILAVRRLRCGDIAN